MKSFSSRMGLLLSPMWAIVACAAVPPPAPEAPVGAHAPGSAPTGLVVSLAASDGCDCAAALDLLAGALGRASVTVAPSDAAHDVELRVGQWSSDATQATVTLLGARRGDVIAESTSTLATPSEHPGEDLADQVVRSLLNDAGVQRYATAHLERSDGPPPKDGRQANDGHVAAQVVGAVVQGVQQGLQGANVAPAGAPAPPPDAPPRAEHHAEGRAARHAHTSTAPQHHTQPQVHRASRPCKPNEKNCSR